MLLPQFKGLVRFPQVKAASVCLYIDYKAFLHYLVYKAALKQITLIN
jgi:hypothetical protein